MWPQTGLATQQSMPQEPIAALVLGLPEQRLSEDGAIRAQANGVYLVKKTDARRIGRPYLGRVPKSLSAARRYVNR
jgi:hypothetical protein